MKIVEFNDAERDDSAHVSVHQTLASEARIFCGRNPLGGVGGATIWDEDVDLEILANLVQQPEFPADADGLLVRTPNCRGHDAVCQILCAALAAPRVDEYQVPFLVAPTAKWGYSPIVFTKHGIAELRSRNALACPHLWIARGMKGTDVLRSRRMFDIPDECKIQPGEALDGEGVLEVIVPTHGWVSPSKVATIAGKHAAVTSFVGIPDIHLSMWTRASRYEDAGRVLYDSTVRTTPEELAGDGIELLKRVPGLAQVRIEVHGAIDVDSLGVLARAAALACPVVEIAVRRAANNWRQFPDLMLALDKVDEDLPECIVAAALLPAGEDDKNLTHFTPACTEKKKKVCVRRKHTVALGKDGAAARCEFMAPAGCRTNCLGCRQWEVL